MVKHFCHLVLWTFGELHQLTSVLGMFQNWNCHQLFKSNSVSKNPLSQFIFI